MRPVFFALAVWCANLTPGIAGPQGFTIYSVPQDMPEVRFVTGDGTRALLSDFRGKAILLNIWATWCPPCVKEMPTLDALQVDLGSQSFEVIPLAIDTGEAPAVRRFFNKVGIEHLNITVDPTQLSFTNLHLAGLPTTLLINADGREVGRRVGPATWNDPEMEVFLKGFAQ